MRTLVLLASCLIVVYAQLGTDVPNQFTVNAETQPYGSSLCALDGKFKNVDKSSYYKASFPGLKRLCVKEYLDVCATVNGVVPCNTFNSKCVEVGYDYDNAQQHPASAAVMAKRPEVCTEQGEFRHPDTATIVVAQIIFSGIVFIGGFVLFLLQVQGSIILKAILGVFLLDCLLLTFSYYYLNAIIIFAAATAAGVCFSLKSDGATGFGFVIILAALYWTTFESGLGSVQHQSRFRAGSATTDFYEKQCNNYYRGYFYYPLEQHENDDNIAISYRGFCDRNWLGAQLFFMIFAQQLLVVFLAVGAYLQFGQESVQVVSVKTVAKDQQ